MILHTMRRVLHKNEVHHAYGECALLPHDNAAEQAAKGSSGSKYSQRTVLPRRRMRSEKAIEQRREQRSNELSERRAPYSLLRQRS